MKEEKEKKKIKIKIKKPESTGEKMAKILNRSKPRRIKNERN